MGMFEITCSLKLPLHFQLPPTKNFPSAFIETCRPDEEFLWNLSTRDFCDGKEQRLPSSTYVSTRRIFPGHRPCRVPKCVVGMRPDILGEVHSVKLIPWHQSMHVTTASTSIPIISKQFRGNLNAINPDRAWWRMKFWFCSLALYKAVVSASVAKQRTPIWVSQDGRDYSQVCSNLRLTSSQATSLLSKNHHAKAANAQRKLVCASCFLKDIRALHINCAVVVQKGS